MRYLTKEDFRILVAIEMGMRNHEMVPVGLITNIAKLRHGGCYKILSTLLRYKLIAHTNQEYNGYRLSYMGYDILALRTLLTRGIISSVGPQIGVGKESDIYEALDPEGNQVVLKLHRLGRTSFRSVRKNRDYMVGKSKASWLYMSRLAAIKEYAFMQALYEHEFPTPIPYAQNRHIVAMSRVDGFPMAQIKSGQMQMDIAEKVFNYCMAILIRLAEHGLVHCDFNEFNLMVDAKGERVTLIDFPQMISTNHFNADEMFTRDSNCLAKFFGMKMKFVPDDLILPKLGDIEIAESLDEHIRASGFSKEDDDILMRFIHDNTNNDDEAVSEIESSDEEEDCFEAPELVDLENNQESIGKNCVFGFSNKEGEEELGIKCEEDDDFNAALHEDGLSDSDEDGNNDLPKLTAKQSLKIKEEVKKNMNRVPRAKSNGTRNNTKRRTKYGKIDRSDKFNP
jgi:RIO kinase 2